MSLVDEGDVSVGHVPAALGLARLAGDLAELLGVLLLVGGGGRETHDKGGNTKLKPCGKRNSKNRKQIHW